MDFLVPSALPPILTYRVMHSDGVMEDRTRALLDVTNGQALTDLVQKYADRFVEIVNK